MRSASDKSDLLGPRKPLRSIAQMRHAAQNALDASSNGERGGRSQRRRSLRTVQSFRSTATEHALPRTNSDSRKVAKRKPSVALLGAPTEESDAEAPTAEMLQAVMGFNGTAGRSSLFATAAQGANTWVESMQRYRRVDAKGSTTVQQIDPEKASIAVVAAVILQKVWRLRYKLNSILDRVVAEFLDAQEAHRRVLHCHTTHVLEIEVCV